MIFNTTDARRSFARVVAEQAAAKRQRMAYARQARQRGPARHGEVFTAAAAMRLVGLGPTPFYTWRNHLGIRPIRKGARQAFYARRDILRIHAAYLAHTRTREVPYDG